MLTEVTPSSVKHVRKPEHQELAILLGVGEAHDFSDPTRLSRLVTIRASQAHERIPLFPEPEKCPCSIVSMRGGMATSNTNS